MAKKGNDPRKTPQWREAENWFSQLYAAPVFSIMGGGLMPGPDAEGLDQELENLLVFCPFYFPGWFYRGEYMLRIGRNPEGEKYVEKGFDHMADILEEEGEFERALYQRIENLEKLLRYDLAARYMEKAVRLFPDTASFYDDLAFYILQLPERDNNDALRMQEKALDLDPDNDYFINNLGWVHLMMGNYKEAENYFRQALDFNIDNPGALKNLDTVEYMQEHKVSYFEYLVRPADMKEIENLLENVDFAGAAELCREYNADRVDAFKIHYLGKKSLLPHEILNIIQPFRFFMNDVEKIAENEIFLYENTNLLYDKFRFLLYHFIISTEFIEESLLTEISRSLTRFYEFLRMANLLTSSEHKRFIDHITAVISEFSRRIEDYNRIRHDINLQEAERQKAIEEIFGMHYLEEGF